jgi:hypothetical protein
MAKSISKKICFLVDRLAALLSLGVGQGCQRNKIRCTGDVCMTEQELEAARARHWEEVERLGEDVWAIEPGRDLEQHDEE